MRPKMKLFAVKFRRIWKFSPDEVYEESFGRIFTICASKNVAVSCEEQTHFSGFHLVRYITKVLCALSRFLRPQTKLFAMKFRRILDVFCLKGLQKNIWAHFHDLCVHVRKWSCFLRSSDAFRKFWPCEGYKESCYHDFSVHKRSCLPWSSDAFWKFSPFKLYKKSCGRNFQIYASKTEPVCREVQTHFGSFLSASFIKKFMAHYHDFCVQQRSCLQWCSDAF